MYTLLIVLNVCGKDVYELVQVNDPVLYFKNGEITRLGKSYMFRLKQFEHYSEDSIMECRCLKCFVTEKIPTFNVKE